MWQYLLERKWLLALGILIVLFIFALIMDKMIMPWYVDLGEEMTMPDIVEKMAPEAKSELEKHGFNVIFADSVYDSNYPQGAIVEQMPVAYSTVKKGRNVYLTVSIGEKPIEMPNLISESPRNAELKLKALGLKLRSFRYDFSDFYPEGAVIGQSYPPGQSINRNAEITLIVSLGEKPTKKTIPNLIGKSLNAARQQLRQLGISIRNIDYEESETYLPQTVLKQDPAAGKVLTEENYIDLIISKLPSNSGE